MCVKSCNTWSGGMRCSSKEEPVSRMRMDRLPPTQRTSSRLRRWMMHFPTRRSVLPVGILSSNLELAHNANVVTGEMGIRETDHLGKVLLVDLAQHSSNVERILGVKM